MLQQTSPGTYTVTFIHLTIIYLPMKSEYLTTVKQYERVATNFSLNKKSLFCKHYDLTQHLHSHKLAINLTIA